MVLGFSGLIFLALFEGVWALYYLSVLNARVEQVYATDLVKIKRLSEIQSGLFQTRAETASHVQSQNAEQMAALADAIDARRRTMAETVATFRAAELPPVEAKLLHTFESTVGLYHERLRNEVLPLSRARRKLEARVAEAVALKEFEKSAGTLTELIDYNGYSAQTRYQYAIADYERTVYVVGLTLAVLLVLALAVAVLVMRSVTRPIAAATAAAGRITAGDLTQPLHGVTPDDLGRLLNAMGDMTTQLRTIVSRVRVGADGVRAASQELVAGNHDLSNRTSAEASALEEIAASMHQITAAAKQNSARAVEANDAVGHTVESAQHGHEAVERVTRSVKAVSDAARGIAEKIGAIDAIAFQTNILALNAAVEAARAGDYGRGFSVVAAEVRALAQRSAGLAKEIKEFIGASVAEVDRSTALVGDAGGAIDAIVRDVGRVRQQIADIARASGEQSAAVAEVNGALAHMEDGAQKNAALVEELAAAATSLMGQADGLVAAVGAFRLEPGAIAPAASPAIRSAGSVAVVKPKHPIQPRAVAARRS